MTKLDAEPILVSAATYRRVGDAMRFAARDPVRIKGKAQPVVTYVPITAAPTAS